VLGRLRTTLSYANVTATFALLVALGGTSYAATQIATKDIKNEAVTGRKIADDAITGVKVKNGSLLAKDFARGQLPVGAPGTPGTPGNPGKDGIGKATAVFSPANNDTYDPLRKKGFVGAGPTLANGGTEGVWCLTVDPALGIDLATVAPIITLEGSTSDNPAGAGREAYVAYFRKDNTVRGCAANQLAVQTFGVSPEGTLDVNTGVGFSIVIP